MRTSIEHDDILKKRRLPFAITAEGFIHFFTAYAFGPVLLLFFNDLGFSKSRIGFLLSLYPFCGLLSLVVAGAAARLGVKRVHITCFGLRKIAFGLLLITPVFVTRYGTQSVFVFVAAVLLSFGIFRAIGETALLPWNQEYVPMSVRGKYTALCSVVSTCSSVFALSVASYVMTHRSGLSRFMIPMGIGVVIGLIGVGLKFFIPGGKPVDTTSAKKPSYLGQMMVVFKDRQFVRYLVGEGFLTLVRSALAFLPLFMRERVGLPENIVVLLTTFQLLGSLLFYYFWGWAADRYGGRPLLLAGIFASAIFPLLWLFLPRSAPLSTYLAITYAFLFGSTSAGVLVGTQHLFFNSVIPPVKKTQYMPVSYACQGIIGGLSPLLAGFVVDYLKDMNILVAGVTFDAYSPLFLASSVLTIAALLFYRGIRQPETVPTGEFLSLFTRGNPVLAAGALIQHSLANNENKRLQVTQRMGELKSPLYVNELVSALEDPSFNVRFEAIVSISRTRPHPHLIDALIGVLAQNDPDLSAAAAWALGRVGSKEAVPALQEALKSEFAGIATRSARALGMIGDKESIPLLLEQMKSGMQQNTAVAYASALGALRARTAIDDIITLIQSTPYRHAVSLELVFALASICGTENRFVRLWRNYGSDVNHAIVHTLQHCRRRLEGLLGISIRGQIDVCAQAVFEGRQDEAVKMFTTLLEKLSAFMADKVVEHILIQILDMVREHGGERPEYLLLGLSFLDLINIFRR